MDHKERKARGPGSFIRDNVPQKPQFPPREIDRMDRSIQIFVIEEDDISRAQRICAECPMYLAAQDGGDIRMRCDGIDRNGYAYIRETSEQRTIQLSNDEIRGKVVRRAACLNPEDHKRLRQLFRT